MAPMKTRPITPPQSVANCWTVSATVAGGSGETVTRPLSAGRRRPSSQGPGRGRRDRSAVARRRRDGGGGRLSVVPPAPGRNVAQHALHLRDVDVEALGQRRRERVALVGAHLVERGVELG